MEPTRSLDGDVADPDPALPDAALLRSAMLPVPGVAVIVFDCEMRIQAVHGSALQRHGYRPQRMLGRLAPDVLPAPLWERLGPFYARALAGETVAAEMSSHDGEAVYEMTFSPVRRDELVVGGMSSARDITAQRAAEEELQLSEHAHDMSERRAGERFERSFTEAPVGMLLVRGHAIERANAAIAGLVGVSADDLVGRDPLEFVHPDDAEQAVRSLGAVADGTAPPPQERRILGPGGSVLHLTLRYSVLSRDDGDEPLVLLHFIDRTAEVAAAEERESARVELSEAKVRLQAILDYSPMAIYMRDLEQRWIVVNPETCRIVGKSAEELIDQPVSDTHSTEVLRQVTPHEREVLAAGEPLSFDERMLDARTGELRHYWSVRFPVHDAEGVIAGLGGVSLDVTDRDRAIRELTAARALFETAFSSAPVGMLVSRVHDDRNNEIVECNPAFGRMVGYEPEELVGTIGPTLVHPDDMDERNRMVDDMLAGRATSGELRFLHSDGHSIEAMAALAMTFGPDGERLVVLQAVDISERKLLEGRLQHLADHDPLTGLFGRRRFEEELEREVSRARRHRRPGALLLVDLDGFKGVNDSLGHSAGDELLAAVAVALRRILRDSDLLARIGGDEFALVLPDADAFSARVVAGKLVDAVRTHGSVTRAGRRIAVTASIGVTALTGGPDLDAVQLLAEADQAMYQAKRAGKDGIAVYARADAVAG